MPGTTFNTQSTLSSHAVFGSMPIRSAAGTASAPRASTTPAEEVM
ncbi:hypothetical protein ACVWXN_007550 [Bradyrhizobium sp. i1.4.4]